MGLALLGSGFGLAPGKTLIHLLSAHGFRIALHGVLAGNDRKRRQAGAAVMRPFPS